MGDKHLLVKKNNRVGLLTLNRPGALNALSYEMFGQLSEALADWQNDPEIYGVVLDSIGDQVFCAGGDIRDVHDRGQKDPEIAAEFLRREYEYNWQLDTFTKPHISLMNGLVLGGGVGISLYGTHRVAGSKFSLAMPETAIGFIPDIGASWFLGHLPYSVGLYLALAGRSINRADAFELGLVTHTIDENIFATSSKPSARDNRLILFLMSCKRPPARGICQNSPAGSRRCFRLPRSQKSFPAQRLLVTRVMAGRSKC